MINKAIILLLIIISGVLSQGVGCVVPIEDGGDTWNMDCYSNYDITETHPDLDRLVIVIHGMNRNGDDYYENMVAAGEEADNNTSIIFSTQFHSDRDGRPSSTLYWNDWRYGGDSDNGPNISNFAMMDTVIERVTTLNPQIKKVIVVGHSAGGDGCEPIFCRKSHY